MNAQHWARAETAHVETLDQGVVVYDHASDEVLCLTGDSAAVLAATTGATIEEIASATGLNSATVAAYLIELADRGLVSAQGSERGLARRSLVGAAGGVAVALGLWSIAAPSPAAAASGGSTS